VLVPRLSEKMCHHLRYGEHGCSSSRPAWQQPSVRMPAPFCGRGAKPGAKGPSRSPWVGRGSPTSPWRATLHGAEILAPAIDLARQLLAGCGYRLRDPAVIRLRLGGGKGR
jgi:hypothetical protein